MKITSQHTYVFPDTHESVTIYQSDTISGYYIALSLSHKENEGTLYWSNHFAGIKQIQSKVNPLIWYMYLTDYWSGNNTIPTERVMIVKDCNA